MSFNFLIDSHTHSISSPDGEESVLNLCQSALEKGIRVLTITDHCELDVYAEQGFEEAAWCSRRDILDAQWAFKGKLEVLLGSEFGQPCHNPAYTKEAESLYKRDFILGSVHNLKDKRDFYYLDYTQENPEEIFGLYLDELLETVEWGGFDSLAHLTYPLRYITGRAKIALDLNKFYDKIDTILRLLAEKDKALEINTSGLRQPIGTLLPEEALVRRFRSLGGKLITVGSDAHRSSDIGFGIEAGLECAKNCGFKSVVYFKNRQAEEVLINA
ncbi:MAG: histidinol-phosphatase HisJ family protein [Oscillospiraceae bacterium]|jgi:histidinol-phosphatase (PHP family)|nr:histidinol-phosphatase HisJ family protein [Oscillospiraceae bacterium]